MQTVINEDTHMGQSCGSKERGISLIEVLIALIVFALGVVGIAGLQLRTMSMTMDSAQRSYAISTSQDIADSIRSSGVAPKDYLTNVGTPHDETNFCVNPVPASCIGRTCATDEIVKSDLYNALCEGDGSLAGQLDDWKVTISCAYPSAPDAMTASLNCDELGATVSIKTDWFARSDNSNPSQTDSMTLSFAP